MLWQTKSEKDSKMDRARDAMGMKLTQVEYTIEATDVPDWAKSLVLPTAEAVHEITLVLKSDGWSAKN
jgi:hypothetical protein